MSTDAPRHFVITVIATLAAMALTTRCSQGAQQGNDADVWVEEAAFQALHVVDLQQTLSIKRHANLCEGSGALDGGWIVGPHPSDRTVYAYMGTEALLHLAVTYALKRYAPAAFARGWELVTISIDGAVVAHNARIGMEVHL